MCVGPDLCVCKPGFSGSNCDVPLCQQKCHNSGVCTNPDTCTCTTGWFGTNCTVPVCTQTCGNGGNCVGPNTCVCAKEWSGTDCRTPVCKQNCQNGGLCVAPDTCICPPNYINYDCSVPVCSQGMFRQNVDTYTITPHIYNTKKLYHPVYKYCNLPVWCNITKEFECDQINMKYNSIAVPYGGNFTKITGRQTAPSECLLLELPLNYKLPYEIVRANGTTTGYYRYSPKTPYFSDSKNPWAGILVPTSERTGPYSYSADRQVAKVAWYNQSQGVYVCANNGNCTSPNVCECEKGWIGFDCRTPVCEQGYYHKNQKNFVSGLETPEEVFNFLRFMGNNSYRLNWPYSNPNYTEQIEYYENTSNIMREIIGSGGKLYEGQSTYLSGKHLNILQGGYRCSIRISTLQENLTFILSSPNYYSRYMDEKTESDGKIYTYWKNMFWPPVTSLSRVLEKVFNNLTFEYTNEGYRKFGIWNITGNKWEYGTCITEFKRNCTENRMKQFDLHSKLFNVYVQDTDLAYRPQIFYTDKKVLPFGRWEERGGECRDEVIHGCYNNGTCIAPNTCLCAQGYTGYSCNIPLCKQTCHHYGICTGIDTCTCEKGWTGYDCSIPICAQECQNSGYCVAPDTCKCNQWPNHFVDGRLAGGRPVYQDTDGNPLLTGWTGYDCGVPICVQAEKFYLNTEIKLSQEIFGGRGGDGLAECNKINGKDAPRCPIYNQLLTTNDGKSYQTGCGYDPYDTGCCIIKNNYVKCYRCDEDKKKYNGNSFFCQGEPRIFENPLLDIGYFKINGFTDIYNNLLLCGSYHQPRYHNRTIIPQDYGIAKYYTETEIILGNNYTNYDYLSNLTSNRFLCNVMNWTQGDYRDDAGLGSVTGVGSKYGLKYGRNVRINTPNIYFNIKTQKYENKGIIAGEGIYGCHNSGSCISPDVCTCEDGYTGFDCSTPLCRHLQPTGLVTACLNHGICESKDNCNCIQTDSILYETHKNALRGLTGWTGTTCLFYFI